MSFFFFFQICGLGPRLILHPGFYKGIMVILFARVLSLIVEVSSSFVLKSYVIAAVVICFGIIFLNFAYPFLYFDET